MLRRVQGAQLFYIEAMRNGTFFLRQDHYAHSNQISMTRDELLALAGEIVAVASGVEPPNPYDRQGGQA